MLALRPVAVVLLLAALPPVVLAAPAAPRRRHGTHGTVRRLCHPARVVRWPGGPVVGRLGRGRDMRRYTFRGAWALGVSQGAPHLYGYVRSGLFCPPSAAGLRALERDRAKTGLAPRRTSAALSRVLERRVCTPHVWVRDHPLERAIGILWLGDVFVARRRARTPSFGGLAFGHEHRHGWVARDALCAVRRHDPEAYSAVTDGPGNRMLTPPLRLPCTAGRPQDGMIVVGVDFARRRGAAIRAELLSNGRVLPGPTFHPGEARSLDRGVVGQFACSSTVTVVYRSLGRGGHVLHRAGVVIEPSDSGRARTATPAQPTSQTAPAPGNACSAPPTLIYAHGHPGPVSHRYDARPALSANGSAVAFDTPLRLSAGDHDDASDVYVRRGADLVLLSDGAAATRAPAISADGRRVAFESDDLALDDGNGERDVFVSDDNGPVRLVSRAPDGRAGAGRSRAPALSADGRLLAFESTAGDLVPGAPPQGIYVRDLGSGATTLAVSRAYRPALSADGHTLVFETTAALARSDRNRTVDVYALRLGSRAGKRPVLVSRTAAGAAGAGRSLAAVSSRDGRFVAFMSSAPDLVRGDRDGLRDVFRRDLRTGTTVLVSRDRCGSFANGYSRYPSISADGRLVVFDSHAGDITGLATHGEGEVYVRDVDRGRTRLMSARRDGQASARTAFSPALSADGHVVAFPSFGADLVAGDDDRQVDQFARGVAAGARVRRVS